MKDLGTSVNYIIVPETDAYRIKADARVIGLVPLLKLISSYG